MDSELEEEEEEEEEELEEEEEEEKDNDVESLVIEEVREAGEAGEAAAMQTRIWLKEQLQSSIFYVEPVSHVTFQLLHVDETGTLTHAETFVVRLTVPNTVGQLDIARVIKRARFSADGSRLEYRLNSLFVYNAHVELLQLATYIRNPAAFNFVTVLTSISSFAFKPTLACFHSLNSIHIVLSAVRVAPITITICDAPRPAPAFTRTVRITQGAISGHSRYSRKYSRKNIIYRRH